MPSTQWTHILLLHLTLLLMSLQVWRPQVQKHCQLVRQLTTWKAVTVGRDCAKAKRSRRTEVRRLRRYWRAEVTCLRQY